MVNVLLLLFIFIHQVYHKTLATSLTTTQEQDYCYSFLWILNFALNLLFKTHRHIRNI